MKICIQFYGKFRDYGQEMIFDCESPCIVSKIKDKLFEKLKLHETDNEALKKLIDSSRLSGDNKVLDDNDTLETETPLSILPPVSGGLE